MTIFLALSTFSYSNCHENTGSNQINKQKSEKEPIIKITNNKRIITKKMMEKIDPKSIKSIDVYTDTIFITLKEPKTKVTQQKKTTK